MSVLDAYLYFNAVNNYTDIHIISEGFFCDLLNIVFGYHLKNANKDNRNQLGYDLIDISDKRVFQISYTTRPEKIKESIEKIESEIEDRKNRITALEEYKLKHKFLTSAEREGIEKKQKEITRIPDVENYRVCFLFLKRKEELSKVLNYKGRDGNGYHQPSRLRFNYKTDIICFDDFISQINYISEEDITTIKC